MIKVNVADCVIFDIEDLIINILTEYKKFGKVKLELNHEGPNLIHCGLYSLLDKLTTAFDIPKQCITIYTPNIEEYHSEYRIKIIVNKWIDRAKFNNINYQQDNKLEIEKHVGLFVYRPSWQRLVLLSWLDKNYSDNILLTCHHDPKNEIHRINIQISELYKEDPESLLDVVQFINKCPILLNDALFDGPPDLTNLYNLDSQIYSKIFLELVAETFVTGAAFSPNEKTFRPILSQTPFIIMGPTMFLSNLRRVGFKTFSDYWDESYDELAGIERIHAIQNILKTEIFSKTVIELKSMYDTMKPILIHNKELLLSLNPGSLKKTIIKGY